MKMFGSMRFLLASLFSLLSSVLLTGCSKDVDPIVVYDVPVEYQPFVDSFIYEASIRGRSIKIDNLIIKNDYTIEGPHCAGCNSIEVRRKSQKIISVNSNIRCWLTVEQQECLFFHELGHCVLGRDHDNGFLPNGELKSLMNESDLGMYSSCVYPVDSEPCDDTFKRPYYLDELFDEDTPVPDWGK